MEFKFQNVNDAFRGLVEGINFGLSPRSYCVDELSGIRPITTVAKSSRAGNVLMIPEPVTVCYERPLQRVLFNQARDANPFFHMFESLWMLAGRNDVASLKYYNSNIGEVASDDGKTFNGAYGYRWRYAWVDDERDHNEPGLICLKKVDQLSVIIDHLKADPNSRRAVLQMWNVEDDLLKIGGEELTKEQDPREWPDARPRVAGSKDVCCNTAAYFSLRKRTDPAGYSLDMTVTNRSNDLIWGMLGANVVHFSFLQEYIANCLDGGIREKEWSEEDSRKFCRVGFPCWVGKYYQFTNNLHVYEDNWHPEKWLGEYKNRNAFSISVNYNDRMKTFIPLVRDKEKFDREVVRFVENSSAGVSWTEPFLVKVAAPMCWAFRAHKARYYSLALDHCKMIFADDWREVCTTWIKKRKANWESVQSSVKVEK